MPGRERPMTLAKKQKKDIFQKKNDITKTYIYIYGLYRNEKIPRVVIQNHVGKPTCVEPVSWFSMKVTALEGHQPITPGGFPWESRRRHSSPLTAACVNKGCSRSIPRHRFCWVRRTDSGGGGDTWRTPFVVKSNAAHSPPALSIQLMILCLWVSMNN